jgi:flagellar hook-associated protein 3 FlgL
MRVTERSLSDNYLSSVNQARERIVDLQSKIATGRSVMKPSDDPRATNSILRLRAALEANEQYTTNVADGSGIAESTADALDGCASLFIQLKEAVTKASSPSSVGEYSTYAIEVDQLLSEAVNYANTRFNGKYLFGGTQTTDPPYTLAADHSSITKNPNGINGTISYSVGEGLHQQVNISGEEAFQGIALFDLLIQIKDNLKNGLPPTAAQVDGVNAGFEHIVLTTSKAGSYVRNMQNLTSHLDDQKTQLTQFLSNDQDSDLAESVTQLKQQETMLEAAMKTGSMSIPKSLVDFL